MILERSAIFSKFFYRSRCVESICDINIWYIINDQATVCVTIKFQTNACAYGYGNGHPTGAGTGVQDVRKVRVSNEFRTGILQNGYGRRAVAQEAIVEVCKRLRQ